MARSPKQSKQSLKNLKKALPWRSPDEARLVRMFVWKYLLGQGPQCCPFALARWLGIQESYIRLLRKKLPLDEAAFLAEAERTGAPTLEALRAARIKSRSMRAQGLLRIQPRLKTINEPVTGRLKEIPAKPNAVTLVLDGKIPLEPPGPGPTPHRGGRPKKRRRKKRTGKFCSREQALANLRKGRPPRYWRGPAESRLVRMFVWQWLLGRGPYCSQCALARWLGVSDTYVRDLKKKLPADPVTGLADFLREVGRSGVPTLDALARARDESRSMRDLNLLRTQRAYRTIKSGEYAGTVAYEWIHTTPSNVTLALDGLTPLQPPRPSPRWPRRAAPGQVNPLAPATNLPAKVEDASPPAPDEFSTRMWQLKMREERAKKVQPILPRRHRLRSR